MFLKFFRKLKCIRWSYRKQNGCPLPPLWYIQVSTFQGSNTKMVKSAVIGSTYISNDHWDFRATRSPNHHPNITVPIHKDTGAHGRQRTFAWCDCVCQRARHIEIVGEAGPREIVHSGIEEDTGPRGSHSATKTDTKKQSLQHFGLLIFHSNCDVMLTRYLKCL